MNILKHFVGVLALEFQDIILKRVIIWSVRDQVGFVKPYTDFKEFAVESAEAVLKQKFDEHNRLQKVFFTLLGLAGVGGYELTGSPAQDYIAGGAFALAVAARVYSRFRPNK